MLTSHCLDPEILDIAYKSLAVVDVYQVTLEADGAWDLSYLLLSVEMDIRLSLRVIFTVIRNKWFEHSIKAPKTDAEVYRLVVRGIARGSVSKRGTASCRAAAQCNSVGGGTRSVTSAPNTVASCGARGYSIQI